jgi:hypothetical protein
MTLSPTISTATANISRDIYGSAYDGDDTAPIRGIAFGVFGSAIFYATCYIIWRLVF